VSRKSNYHVVLHPDGRAVCRENALRVSGVYSTQNKAIDAGRPISKIQGAKLLIYGKNGQSCEKDSHGNHTFPRKG
jgi:hypothetical protein